MKKIILSIITLSFLTSNLSALALNEITTENTKETSEQSKFIANDAPQWEDYVPAKYLNKQPTCTRGGAIAELSTGILLTDLLITAPIGIPLIVHGKKRLNIVNYSDKKPKFEQDIAEARLIQNDEQRKAQYEAIIKKYKLKKQK